MASSRDFHNGQVNFDLNETAGEEEYSEEPVIVGAVVKIHQAITQETTTSTSILKKSLLMT